MTKPFAVGDTVTDIILGKTGKVLNCSHTAGYPIAVRYPDGLVYSYAIDGRCKIEDKVPRLYHGEVTIEIKQPVYEYQVVYKTPDCGYQISTGHFTDAEHWKSTTAGKTRSYEFIELYQPSKRVRK